ncbi:hypothetical protein NQ317_006383 [Molorchus minor]|uniref:Uncharacterized protein n=1 Tax=Molorchus minor TaxID=1323400 RepID=A0ABQ9ITA6_9CUCU|nr:hypothetical protein NQ317_006383 [Molorchus minor]
MSVSAAGPSSKSNWLFPALRRKNTLEVSSEHKTRGWGWLVCGAAFFSSSINIRNAVSFRIIVFIYDEVPVKEEAGKGILHHGHRHNNFEIPFLTNGIVTCIALFSQWQTKIPLVRSAVVVTEQTSQLPLRKLFFRRSLALVDLFTRCFPLVFKIGLGNLNFFEFFFQSSELMSFSSPLLRCVPNYLFPLFCDYLS